jgi:hypothetical protein
MIEYIVKIYNVKIEGIGLMQWVGVCYLLMMIRWQLLCCGGSIRVSCM